MKMMTIETPGTDPRWQNERIQQRRVASYAVADRFPDEDKAKMLHHLEGELRDIGVTRITEDLVLLLWGTMSPFLDFVATSIQLTCQNPHTGYHAFSHTAAGTDMLGVILFALEEKIGQPL